MRSIQLARRRGHRRPRPFRLQQGLAAESAGSGQRGQQRRLQSSPSGRRRRRNAAAAGVGAGLGGHDRHDAGGFVTAAATSDMYEVAAGQDGATEGDQPGGEAVRRHDGPRSHRQHREAEEAAGRRRDHATPPADMDERRKGMINNLNGGQPGADFDKMYIDQQVAAHEEARDPLPGLYRQG